MKKLEIGDNLDVNNCETVTINGNVGDIQTMSGSIHVEGVVGTMSGNITYNK